MNIYYAPLVFLLLMCTLPLLHIAVYALLLPFNRTEEDIH